MSAEYLHESQFQEEGAPPVLSYVIYRNRAPDSDELLEYHGMIYIYPLSLIKQTYSCLVLPAYDIAPADFVRLTPEWPPASETITIGYDDKKDTQTNSLLRAEDTRKRFEKDEPVIVWALAMGLNTHLEYEFMMVGAGISPKEAHRLLGQTAKAFRMRDN